MNATLLIDPPSDVPLPPKLSHHDELLRCLKADVWPDAEILLLYGIFTTDQFYAARVLVCSDVVGARELSAIEGDHKLWNTYIEAARLNDLTGIFPA